MISGRERKIGGRGLSALRSQAVGEESEKGAGGQCELTNCV